VAKGMAMRRIIVRTPCNSIGEPRVRCPRDMRSPETALKRVEKPEKKAQICDNKGWPAAARRAPGEPPAWIARHQFRFASRLVRRSDVPVGISRRGRSRAAGSRDRCGSSYALPARREVLSIDDFAERGLVRSRLTQDSVYQAVASLRRLLGDDARQPAYIATVPRLDTGWWHR